MNLYLDIETIPSQSPEVHARIAETITPPGNYKKADSIAQWEAEQKPALVKEAIARTALDGAHGHVCCIGWAVGDGVPDATYLRAMTESYERTIIKDFLNAVDDIVLRQPRAVTVVGHNVCSFDIRFLWQRAIVLGIRMPGWFPRDPKPWGQDVFDTQTAFAGQRGTISLDRLAQALGFPGKGDIDGSMVGQMWADGKHDEIAAYCRADVERTRQIHRRMLVAFGEAA